MTERLLGEPGPERKRRRKLAGLVLVLAAALLVVVAQAAGADPESPPYVITNDENGPNDVPGQKDLNLHGIDSSGLPTQIKVLWNWDELGTSGNNSLDACTLFDTDTTPNGFADVAVCVTTQGNPATKKAATVYTCGDTRVDRCASQIAVISAPNTTASCTVTSPSATDPFAGPANKDKGAGYPNDTRGKCTIFLAEINATAASLINTCSYPSTQPNSDPSDCVLIPRDAFITIVKVADPSNQGSFPFSLDGTAVFTASGSQTSSPIAITTANNATHDLSESVPSGWSLDSATCVGAGDSNGTKVGSTINDIDAQPEDSITCTFRNTLQRATVNVSKSGSDNGSQAGAVFTLYQGSGTGGAVVGSCTVQANGTCTPAFSNLLPGQYTIDETTVPAGYTKDSTLPLTFSVVAGETKNLSFTNAAQPGSAAIAKVDDAGNPVDGAVFTIYANFGQANQTTVGSCTTGVPTAGSGACTISGIAAGTYTIDETPPSGYAKDATFPKSITITNGQTTNVTATDPRQFKAIVIVCRQHDSSLYSSAITINGTSAGSSVTSAQATSAGLSAADQTAICGLTQGARSGLLRSGNPHSAAITIP
jgi:hypothetical protein